MNRDFQTPANRAALLETFAAELTLAAYRVALRTRTQGTWLDLQLGSTFSIVKANRPGIDGQQIRPVRRPLFRFSCVHRHLTTTSRQAQTLLPFSVLLGPGNAVTVSLIRRKNALVHESLAEGDAVVEVDRQDGDRHTADRTAAD
jgi:hypothetical protein